jgi:hypothetical protein
MDLSQTIIDENGHMRQARRLWRHYLISCLNYSNGAVGGFAIHLRDCLALVYASGHPSRYSWMLRLHLTRRQRTGRARKDALDGRSDDDDNGLSLFSFFGLI